MRIFPGHGPDQFAGAAPDIHQADDAAEVVGTEHIRRHETRQVGHRSIQDLQQDSFYSVSIRSIPNFCQLAQVTGQAISRHQKHRSSGTVA
jgi:hypothetical protein